MAKSKIRPSKKKGEVAAIAPRILYKDVKGRFCARPKGRMPKSITKIIIEVKATKERGVRAAKKAVKLQHKGKKTEAQKFRGKVEAVASWKGFGESKKKSKRPTLKKVTPKKATPKKDTPKKTGPKKGTPKKATPKKDTPKKTGPKKGTPKKATPKKATPKKTGPKKGTKKPTTPQASSKRRKEPAEEFVSKTIAQIRKEERDAADIREKQAVERVRRELGIQIERNRERIAIKDAEIKEAAEREAKREASKAEFAEQTEATRLRRDQKEAAEAAYNAMIDGQTEGWINPVPIEYQSMIDGSICVMPSRARHHPHAYSYFERLGLYEPGTRYFDIVAKAIAKESGLTVTEIYTLAMSP